MNEVREAKTFKVPVDDDEVALFKAKCAMEKISMGEKIAAYIRDSVNKKPAQKKVA